MYRLKALKKIKLKAKMALSKTASCGGIILIHKSPMLNKAMRKDICRASYEAEELKALKVHLKSTDKVLELGACVGLISAFAAKVCGSDSVKTVEANSEIIPLAKENYALNHVAPEIINGVATHEDAGNVTFYVCDNICSSARHEQAASRAITVPSINVNTLINSFKPNFLVMDIEGGENDLLPLLNLADIEKLLIEVHPYKTSDQESSKLINYLLNSGFVLDFKLCSNYTYMFIRAS